MIIKSNSVKDTFNSGSYLAKLVKANSIICLSGSLGAGKTVFVKGFAKALGIEEEIVSPTFTLVQEYEEGRIPMYHMDLYRIENTDEFIGTGAQELLDANGICLIEWYEKIQDFLIGDEIKVSISIESDNSRIIKIEGIDENN